MIEDEYQYRIDAHCREAELTFRPITIEEFEQYKIYVFGVESPHGCLIADNGVITSGRGEIVML